MSGSNSDWKENVEELKKTLAKSKELSIEMEDIAVQMDTQLVRARKLLKKKPKVAFSQAIQKSDPLPPVSPSA